MEILTYLQRIGRSLLISFAVLPATAIMMGIGYWLDPSGWGVNSTIAALLIKSGSAIISNMPILFAIGVAYGISKDKDGAAALSGLVGFLVVTTLLSRSSVSLLTSTPIEEVSPAFDSIDNQFIGILVGVLSAELYNKFSTLELPKALFLFSGRRSVPIIVSFVMIFVSFALLYIWPAIYNALVLFGESIKDLGAAGAGLYGFFNRILLPIGMHHAFNSVFWFDVAGIDDITNFLGGSKSLADGTAILGITGRYQAGFFPIMMFGLPGAALAILHTAHKGYRGKTASVMAAAAVAAFFTGVTEPIEFSFMLVAPVLYFIHAILTGLSLYIAASMQWIAGFGFSAGLIDLILSSRNPLAVHWYMLIAQGVVFFIAYYVIFKFFILKFNLKTLGRQYESKEVPVVENPIATLHLVKLANGYIKSVGGKENITSIEACVTRLRLEVKDSEIIDIDAAQDLGAMAVVRLSKQSVQIIVGTQAEKIANIMREIVNDTNV